MKNSTALSPATQRYDASSAVGPEPNPTLSLTYYAASPSAPTDLWLAGNEGRAPAGFSTRVDGATLGRYPTGTDLIAKVAKRFAIDPSRVLLTAGADDGLLRLALAYLRAGREIILPTPTFVMIERYAKLAGGTIVPVSWPAGSPYPTEAVLSAVSDRTALIAMVSPNNPTGNVATPQDLRRISAGAPHSLIVLDGAYAEFADEKLTQTALVLPNVAVLRTFSKAYGCAGLRVGYVLGSTPVIDVLRTAGNPYPCASPSLAAAAALMDSDVRPFVQQVAMERLALASELSELGLDAYPGAANFVYAKGPRAPIVADLLAGLGIAVRSFPAAVDRHQNEALRITCPGEPRAFSRLIQALKIVESPEAILFDMDGVLVDVSNSYRAAIKETAKGFGVAVSDEDIERSKRAGDANDDWRLTQTLLLQAGVVADLADVTARFEHIYQGSPERLGLKTQEKLALDPTLLSAMAQSFRLGIVTGRPRSDAEYFLSTHGIADLFDVVITRDDAPLKPDPAPTRLALERLGIKRAWLIGDTPDDIRSAKSAGVLGIGVAAPPAAPGLSASHAGKNASTDALYAAGAGSVLNRIDQLLGLLP